jgi:DNA-binding transcriptional LysR family regulator
MRSDLRYLSAFVAVAEELNFHRAAERLAMTQPAVSRVVQDMEERLGVKLLERTTRKVRLTEAGRYLQKEAQEILSRVDAAENAVRQLAAGSRGILRIGYTTITGHSLVPDIAREFRLANPQVRLELTYLTSPIQRDRILQGEIDFGFIEGSFQSPEIETLPVARHRLVALMSPDHPFVAKRSLTIADLAKEPLVMGTNEEWPTFRRIVIDAFQSAGQILNIGQEASSLTGILGLVTAGMGITVFCGVPRFCGERAIVSRPIATNPPVVVETYLAWRRASTSVLMRHFIDTSRAVGKNYRTL